MTVQGFESINLNSHNIEEVSRRTGRTVEALQIMLRNSFANNTVVVFTFRRANG